MFYARCTITIIHKKTAGLLLVFGGFFSSLSLIFICFFLGFFCELMSDFIMCYFLCFCTVVGIQNFTVNNENTFDPGNYTIRITY